jgi:tRNA 5-methylaminomethyl-2-thiouridine biosynthesis bifunctional protein
MPHAPPSSEPRHVPGRHRVVLHTALGDGERCLARWAAWRATAPGASMSAIVIAPSPPERATLRAARPDSPYASLRAELAQAWPPLTPDLHTLSLDEGRLTILLAVGSVDQWLPQLVAQVDEFCLTSEQGQAPTWDLRQYKSITRLAAPGAIVWVPGGQAAHRHALRTAGFDAAEQLGSTLQFRFADAAGDSPRKDPTRRPGRRLPPPPGRIPAHAPQTALVVGAGLAGASAARALARQGLQVTVLESQAQAATLASGNVAGLFHGVVHAHDGAHARWLRAGALRTRQWLEQPLANGLLPGSLGGLLRGAEQQDLPDRPPAWLDALGLPSTYVRWLSTAQAQSQAGCPVSGPAWWYPGGGWVHPPGLVAWCLAQAGVTLRTDHAVAALARADSSGWQARDAAGRTLAQADVIVLANAHDMVRLLPDAAGAAHWPWQSRRGQVTQLSARQCEGLTLPRPALTSGGYLIPLPATLGGGLLCGATSQLDDTDTQCRPADHAHNLAHITALTGQTVDPALLGAVSGRVGWRLGCDDRLPVVGPVPVWRLVGRRLDQARHVPRIEGLYVLGALGSRGLSLAPLLGEVLAAWVCGSPMPVGADLLDAVDPARFVSRAVRQGRQARPATQATGLSSAGAAASGAD